ncbi:alpha/beta-hydrolase [Xylariomycetidae sp. FL2044]|nr:alpha/beta-hydrolase [Xylariomycetidae sp. FL2044]
MKSILPSEFFNFEYVRVLGMAPVNGAEVGECLDAAAKIKSNDPESWYHAWSGAAETAEAAGEEAVLAGDKETARCAYLRACNYRRASEFMLHVSPEDPRLLPIMTQAVQNFKTALKFFESSVITLDIPYERHKLPGYLYLPQPGSGTVGDKVPLIVNTNGFDSVQEELYFFTAAGTTARGYATLTFDGPGQGIVLRRDKLSIRPDWEVVIAAVLDHLFALAEDHPEWHLDLSKVALTGAAMGGYFALRGALDPRVKACISTDGFYDFEAAVRDRSPFFARYLSDGISDSIIDFVCKFQVQLQFELGHAKLAFGTKSVSEALRRLACLTLEPKGEKTVCARIKCPTLVTTGRDSIYKIEARRIYDELTSLQEGETKEFWDPPSPGQGSLQAKAAAITHFNAKTITWLDQVFGIQRESLV